VLLKIKLYLLNKYNFHKKKGYYVCISLSRILLIEWKDKLINLEKNTIYDLFPWFSFFSNFYLILDDMEEYNICLL